MGVWPFPFTQVKEAQIEEHSIAVGERDVDGVFTLDTGGGGVELVVYDLKRQSVAFGKEEKAGKNKKGKHFELFFKYNVLPHIEGIEAIIKKKIVGVHVVALAGFLDHDPDVILAKMQVLHWCYCFPRVMCNCVHA